MPPDLPRGPWALPEEIMFSISRHTYASQLMPRNIPVDSYRIHGETDKTRTASSIPQTGKLTWINKTPQYKFANRKNYYV